MAKMAKMKKGKKKKIQFTVYTYMHSTSCSPPPPQKTTDKRKKKKKIVDPFLLPFQSRRLPPQLPARPQPRLDNRPSP